MIQGDCLEVMKDIADKSIDLQFLTWFENRAKNDMSQDEWNKVKANMKDYLI